MPNPTLQAAMKEAYAAAPDDVVILDTIEIRHPSFDQPIRVVRDHTPLDARLEASAPQNPGEVVRFWHFDFRMSLPEVTQAGSPEVTLEIDNVSREIIRNIEKAMASPEVIEITYRPYISTDLESPQMDPPLTMQIKSIKGDVFKVTARCGFSDLSNKTFPGQEYTVVRFPGLSQ